MHVSAKVKNAKVQIHALSHTHWRKSDTIAIINHSENVAHGVPLECQETVTQYPSPGYQTNQGLCKPLGKLERHSWHLLDNRHPQRGILLHYKGGEPCPNGREREMTFALICAPHFHHAGPMAVVETKQICHYNITWPTPYACPRRTLFSGIFHLLHWATTIFILYIVIRWALTMYTEQTGLSLAACPHRAVWIEILGRLRLPAWLQKVKNEEEGEFDGDDFDRRFPMEHSDAWKKKWTDRKFGCYYVRFKNIQFDSEACII